MVRFYTIVFLLLAALFTTPIQASAVSVLIREGETNLYGYGKNDWDEMTDLMNSELGSSNISVVTNFNSVNLDDYDTVWVDIGIISQTLGAGEITKLQSFIDNDKKVVLFGENDYWGTWNGSLLNVVSATDDVEASDEVLTPSLSHQLTRNISNIRVIFAGTTSGGTSLFSKKVVTLWGDNLNVFLAFDINMFDDDFINDNNNRVFAHNLLNWLQNYEDPTNQSGSSSSGVFSHPSTTETPSCNDAKPAKIPDLFEIKVNGTNATLNFTTVFIGSTGYSINFGLNEKADQFGDNFTHQGPQWILDRTIHNLAPNTEYYFKLRANNGCNAGDWSNTMKIKTNSK